MINCKCVDEVEGIPVPRALLKGRIVIGTLVVLVNLCSACLDKLASSVYVIKNNEIGTIVVEGVTKRKDITEFPIVTMEKVV